MLKPNKSAPRSRLLELQQQAAAVVADVARIENAIGQQQQAAVADPLPELEAERARLLAGVALGEVSPAEVTAVEKRLAAAVKHRDEQQTARERTNAVLAGLEARRVAALERLEALRTDYQTTLLQWVETKIADAARAYVAAAESVIAARGDLAGHVLIRERIVPEMSLKPGALRDSMLCLPALTADMLYLTAHTGAEVKEFREDWGFRNEWRDEAIRAAALEQVPMTLEATP